MAASEEQGTSQRILSKSILWSSD